MKITPNIIETQNGKKYEKPSTAKTAGAIVVANMAGGGAISGISQISRKIFQTAQSKINQTDKDVFKYISDIAYDKSGLKEKGVKFIDTAITPKKDIYALFEKITSKQMQKTPMFKNLLETLINGKNALFNPKGNFILLNKDKIAIAAPHEIGHALNSTGKGLGKILSKTRTPFQFLTSIALLTALFKRKKVEGEEPKNTWDKATTFVKNNCGKIAFLCSIPMLAEEALASVKGYKLAKATGLAPKYLNKLAKLQGAGFVTHLISATSIAIATIITSKVRDKMTMPKEIK